MAYNRNSDFVAVLNEIANGLDTAEVNWDTAVQELRDLATEEADDDAMELEILHNHFDAMWGDFNTFYLRVTGEED